MCVVPSTPTHLNPSNYLFLSGVSAIAIALGHAHTCAIVSGGGVKCWGWNGYGQLGIGGTTDATRPADVAGDGGASLASSEREKENDGKGRSKSESEMERQNREGEGAREKGIVMIIGEGRDR